MTTKIYKINGMQCTGCADSIVENIKKIENVADASVDFDSKSMSITGSPEEEVIQKVVEALGYSLQN